MEHTMQELLDDLNWCIDHLVQSNLTRTTMKGVVSDLEDRIAKDIELARREGYGQCQSDQREHLMKLHGG